MPLPDTRVSLIQRLQDHKDASAWSEFCAVYERTIYSIGKKYGLQDADAREVSQEVLLTVSRRINDFDTKHKGRFRSWLGTIARNATIDLLRKNQRHLAGKSDILNCLESEESLHEHSQLFDIEARREQFRWAAQKVQEGASEKSWDAFWKTAVQGETSQSVAKQLDMSVGAIYVARCRILSKIKSLVEPFRGDPQ